MYNTHNKYPLMGGGRIAMRKGLLTEMAFEMTSKGLGFPPGREVRRKNIVLRGSDLYKVMEAGDEISCMAKCETTQNVQCKILEHV